MDLRRDGWTSVTTGTDDLWDELVMDSGSVSTHVHMLGVRTSV